MSGRKQHHIPRLHLRGFLAERPGKRQKVCVYRRGQEPYVDAIESVAAERDFNSSPATDGSVTLDDRITNYEGERLTPLVQGLRRREAGDAVEVGVAAEVVGHLALRAAHIRSMFHHGMHRLADVTAEAFSDGDTVARMMGLDQLEPGAVFREKVLERLREEPGLSGAFDSGRFMEQLVFWFARENFATFYEPQSLLFEGSMKSVLSDSHDVIRASHVKALEEGLGKPMRLDDLRRYKWSIEAAPPEGALMPDCVAIAYSDEGEARPFLAASRDQALVVVMPVSTGKLLVGRKPGGQSVALEGLNDHLAACSHDFFICATQTPANAARLALLGSASMTMVEDAISGAARDILPPALLPAPAPWNELPQEPVTPVLSYDLCLADWGDQQTADVINEAMRPIVSAVARTLPLTRLDGITFADDYPAALAALDRGVEGMGPARTTSEDIGVGVAQAPLFMREGVVKKRIICRAGVALALISPDDEEGRRWAIHILISQLASVALAAVIDEAFPGVLLRPYPDQFEGFLAEGLCGAQEAYFTALWSAGFGDDEALEAGYRDLLIEALVYARDKVVEERLAYRTHADLDRLVEVVLGAVQRILVFAATLMGQCDGMDRSPFDEDGRLEALLNEMGMRAWFDLYQRDLESFWSRRGQWASAAEMTGFNRHVERLLWQLGLFPWVTPEEMLRIEVPLVTDMAALAQMEAATPSLEPNS